MGIWYCVYTFEDVPFVGFMHPVFICMPGEVTIGNSSLCCRVPCLLSAIKPHCLLSNHSVKSVLGCGKCWCIILWPTNEAIFTSENFSAELGLGTGYCVFTGPSKVRRKLAALFSAVGPNAQFALHCTLSDVILGVWKLWQHEISKNHSRQVTPLVAWWHQTSGPDRRCV